MVNSVLGNSLLSAEPWNPTFVGSNVGDLSALGYIISRTVAPLSAVEQAEALGPIASQTGSFTPTATGLSGVGGLGGLGTLAGAHTGGAEASASVGKATLVRALSAPHSWATLAAPAAAVGPAGPVSSPVAAPLGIGAGSTALPGTPMPGNVHGRGRFARRYGFRPAVTARPPTGG
jgi:hypothetical protein